MKRKIIGALLLLLCFGLVFVITVYSEGLKVALLAFGIVAILAALAFLGAWLLA